MLYNKFTLSLQKRHACCEVATKRPYWNSSRRLIKQPLSVVIIIFFYIHQCSYVVANVCEHHWKKGYTDSRMTTTRRSGFVIGDKLCPMSTNCGNSASTWTQHDDVVFQTRQSDWCTKTVSVQSYTFWNTLLHQKQRWSSGRMGVLEKQFCVALLY